MKTTTITRLLLLTGSALLGVVALGGEARGDTTTAAAAAPTAANAPSYADLSVGRMTTPPAKKIDFVAASSSVPGLYVVSPPYNQNLPVNQRQILIVGDEKMAATLKGQGSSGSNLEAPAACVGTSERNFRFASADEPLEWTETLGPQASAYPKNADNYMSGVIAVHSERIVENGATASLESIDAWVDPGTRGAKLIAKSTLPLKLVRGPGFGLKVYAGRDERADGKRFVQFVVIRPKTTTIEEAQRTSQMWTMHQDGNITHASGCGHMRVSLPIDGKDKDKAGDMATVFATVLLPSDDTSTASTSTPATTPAAVATPAPAAPPAPPSPPTIVVLKNGKKVKQPVNMGFFPGANAAPQKEHDVRSRMVNIQVSVSQISRDKDPLVSVSSMWSAREAVDHIRGSDSESGF